MAEINNNYIVIGKVASVNLLGCESWLYVIMLVDAHLGKLVHRIISNWFYI